VTSWQMGVVAAYVRLTRRRAFASPEGGKRLLESEKSRSDPPARMRRRVGLEVRDVGGHRVWSVTGPGGSPEPGSVVYLHGGAYTSEIASQHWSLVERLARDTERTVHVPLYGLAPEHDALEAFDFVRAVAAALPAGEPVHLAGDSAGGGLALILAQHWPDDAPPLVGVTLIAPWLDLAMSNPGIDEVEPHDPWLTRPGLHVIADAWAGGLSPHDPRVSPVRGVLDGLPPMAVHVGTRDITVADCRLLRDLLGPDRLRYVEVPGAIHVHPLLPVPEGRAARGRITAFVRETLDGYGR
jgi:monoterpene epsilon-lactone hydrolase